jgi:hypothetical protein
MKAPSYSPPPIDPATLQAEQTAQNQTIDALQTQDRGDMGSLMAAYGTLALGIGNTGGLGGSAGAKAVMTGKA